jgi:hypothetical protein
VETNRLASVEEDVRFATAQSGADLSRDGGDDLIMATLELDQSGPVYLFNGPIQGELGTADSDAVVYSDASYSDLGDAVSMTGDVNGDGHTDLLIGAKGAYAEGGAAYLLHGPVTGDLHVDEAVAMVQRQRSLGRLGEGRRSRSAAGRSSPSARCHRRVCAEARGR